MRCEERGHVQVKGITQPVATYVVIGLKQDAEQAGTAHLRLELDADRMSDDERKAAADALRRARTARKRRPSLALSDVADVACWHLSFRS